GLRNFRLRREARMDVVCASSRPTASAAKAQRQRKLPQFFPDDLNLVARFSLHVKVSRAWRQPQHGTAMHLGQGGKTPPSGTIKARRPTAEVLESVQFLVNSAFGLPLTVTSDHGSCVTDHVPLTSPFGFAVDGLPERPLPY